MPMKRSLLNQYQRLRRRASPSRVRWCSPSRVHHRLGCTSGFVVGVKVMGSDLDVLLVDRRSLAAFQPTERSVPRAVFVQPPSDLRRSRERPSPPRLTRVLTCR